MSKKEAKKFLLRKMGRYEEPIAEGEKGVKLSGGSPVMSAALAQTFAAAAKRNKAVEILNELTKLAKQKYVVPYYFAGIHAGLGKEDRAMEYLEKSYEEHSHWLIYLHIDPSMDGLRSKPRFSGTVRECRPSLTILKACRREAWQSVPWATREKAPRS
ncbi:MAG: hypothetical protein WBL50_21825 [Candidatus Acidiferrum sp.]